MRSTAATPGSARRRSGRPQPRSLLRALPEALLRAQIRPLLGALLAVTVLSGCTLNNPYDNDKVPASKAVADLSPDTATAVKAVGRLRDQIALLTAVAARYPGIGPALADLTRLHQAQLAKLVDAVPPNVSTDAQAATPTLPPARRRVLLSVVNGEEALRLYLIGFAETARSGPFARLLGEMSAAIAQHAVVLRPRLGLGAAPTTFAFASDPYEAHTRPSKAAIDALQAALAGQHAAVYLTGVYGAQASKSRQPALFKALLATYHAHRKARDELSVMITDLGAVPVAAAVAYALPTSMSTTAELNGAALQVERRTAATFGQLVENTAGAERRWALVALDSAAVRQLEFRGTPEMFPGSTS